MGRFIAILGIWLAGFSLGFIGYLAFPLLSEMAITIWPFLLTMDTQIMGAVVAGVASSIVMIFAVTIWAYASRPNSI
jgi:uncharacterized membrane protein